MLRLCLGKVEKIEFFLFCPTCSMEIAEDLFINHMRTHPITNLIYCRLCLHLVFRTPEDYMRHMNVHSTKMQCQYCNKTFPTRELLEEHERSHIKYTCFICYIVFRSLPAFEEHRKTHSRKQHVSSFSALLQNAIEIQNASTSQLESPASVSVVETHGTRNISSEFQNASTSQPEAPAIVSFDEISRTMNEFQNAPTSQPEASAVVSFDDVYTINISDEFQNAPTSHPEAPAAESLEEIYRTIIEAPEAESFDDIYTINISNELQNAPTSQPEAPAVELLDEIHGTINVSDGFQNAPTSKPEAQESLEEIYRTIMEAPEAVSFDDTFKMNISNEFQNAPTSQPEAPAVELFNEIHGTINMSDEFQNVPTSQPEAPAAESLEEINRTIIETPGPISFDDIYTMNSSIDVQYPLESHPEALAEVLFPEIYGVSNLSDEFRNASTSQSETPAAVSLPETYRVRNPSDEFQNASTSQSETPAGVSLPETYRVRNLSDEFQNASTSQPEISAALSLREIRRARRTPTAVSFDKTWVARNRIVLDPRGRSASTSRISQNRNETNTTYSTYNTLSLEALLDAPIGENRYETAYTAAGRNSNEREDITLANLLGSPPKRNRYETENISTHGTVSSETGNSSLPGTDTNENRDQDKIIFKSPRKRKL